MRRRRGYNALASSEEDESIAYAAEAQETDALQVPETEVAEQEGWSALAWSFAASGVMTVSPPVEFECHAVAKLSRIAGSLFLSGGVLHTSLRNIPSVGMAVDVHA